MSIKKVKIKTFSNKHRKMMTWTEIKLIDDKIVFSEAKYLKNFVQELQEEGIRGLYGKKYFPEDGLDFLIQLKNHFNGSRMVATDIIEEENSHNKHKTIQEPKLSKESEELNNQAKIHIQYILRATKELERLGVLRSKRILQADYSEWLVSKMFDLELSDNPVEKSFDAKDKQGKKYQIKCRIVNNLESNTSFDFKKIGKFDYLIAVFFNNEFELIGLLKVEFEVVKELANKNRQRFSFRINKKNLKDSRVEKIIWKDSIT